MSAGLPKKGAGVLEMVALLAKPKYRDRDGDVGTSVGTFVGIEIFLLVLTYILIGVFKSRYWEDRKLVRGRWVRVVNLPKAKPGQRISVIGAASAGPDGILRAPLSGEPCVWWSVTTEEFGPGAADGELRECSENAFAVEDATGGIVVPPGEHGVRGAATSLRRESACEERPDVKIVQQECIIAEGAMLQVNGTPSAGEGGIPVFPGDKAHVATTDAAYGYRSGLYKGLVGAAVLIPLHIIMITVFATAFRTFMATGGF